MSVPAIFALICDGEMCYFEDRGTHAFLFRQLLLGLIHSKTG